MPKFKYIATDRFSKIINGTVEASDKEVAINSVISEGLRPISVAAMRDKSSSGFSFAKLLGANSVKSDDLVIFTRQLSAMVSAGVPLLRALTSLQEHIESHSLQKIIGNIVIDVQSGSTLGDALAKHPEAFNDVYVNMVRAGETAGILDDILKRLAIQQEKSASMRKKIKSAMTYPMVLIVITILSFFGLMVFVIPQIGKIIKDMGGPDAKLPLITQIMLGISGFMISYWYIILPVLFAIVFLVARYIKTPTGKRVFHSFILKLPAIKTIVQKVVVARFSRTFSALMGAGVAVLESLTVTAHALGNVIYEEALLQAVEEVKNGKNLSQVIAANPMFPSIVAQMLAVGEETGQTDTVLVKVADFYEEEVDTAIEGISSIIEPVMIVVMGGVVGLIAASVMMPIAGLAQQVK